jgi:hypothetical protein
MTAELYAPPTIEHERPPEELLTPVQVELFAIDAAGNRLDTTIPAQPEHFDDEVTYSIKNLRGE